MLNWFLNAYEEQLKPTGYIIACGTNVPCHQWLFWTTNCPWRHKVAGQRRGLLEAWDTYWCFDYFKMVEQNEPGDTLTHTFNLFDWPICQTRWFVMKAEVAGAPSPSITPIFKLHHKGDWTPPSLIYARRLWMNESGRIWTISDLNQLVAIFYTDSSPRHITGVDFWMQTTPDKWMSVSIYNVDANNWPTGLALDYGMVNIKHGTRYCRPDTFHNYTDLDITLPPNTQFALLFKSTEDVGKTWATFRRIGWECPYVYSKRKYLATMRSNDAGLTWRQPSDSVLFQLWGYIPPTP